MINYGFVYVLRNDCMPGIFKIGYTDRAPMQRCEELSGSTSIPCAFEMVCYGEIDGAQSLESALHVAWDANRLRRGREFFRLGLGDLHRLVTQITDAAENFTCCDGLHREECSAKDIPYSSQCARYFVSQHHDIGNGNWEEQWSAEAERNEAPW